MYYKHPQGDKHYNSGIYETFIICTMLYNAILSVFLKKSGILQPKRQIVNENGVAGYGRLPHKAVGLLRFFSAVIVVGSPERVYSSNFA